MADSTNVATLPVGMDVYAAYDDGDYTNYNQVKARFPGVPVMSITVNPNFYFGNCLDVEKGDATPAQAPYWAWKVRAAGGNPIVYCSQDLWATVEAAFTSQKVAQPQWWIADYSTGPVMVPGTIGHQWQDVGNRYDESVIVDYIPGVDPKPQGGPMTVSNCFPWNGTINSFQVTGGACYHKWAIGTQWQLSENVVTEAAKLNPAVGNPQFPDQQPGYSIIGSQLTLYLESSTGTAYYFSQQAGGSTWAAQIQR